MKIISFKDFENFFWGSIATARFVSCPSARMVIFLGDCSASLDIAMSAGRESQRSPVLMGIASPKPFLPCTRYGKL